MTKQQAVELILAALRETIDELPRQLRFKVSPRIPLVGCGTPLDSLGLVQFLIAVEERIHDKTGLAIALMDERALSQAHSPFRSVDRLADYLVTLVNGQGEKPARNRTDHRHQ